MMQSMLCWKRNEWVVPGSWFMSDGILQGMAVGDGVFKRFQGACCDHISDGWHASLAYFTYPVA